MAATKTPPPQHTKMSLAAPLAGAIGSAPHEDWPALHSEEAVQKSRWHSMVERIRAAWPWGSPVVDASINEEWSFVVRLAALSDFYVMIVPSDLASLIKEAKRIHPEVALHAQRRDAAVREWVSKAVDL